MLISSGTPALAQHPSSTPTHRELTDTSVVAQVSFNSTDDLNQLASYLDIWEVNHEAGYLVAMLSPEQYATLQQAGYRTVIDQAKTASLYQLNVLLPGQGLDSIPGYPCYRTVEETYASMQNIANNYPNLAELVDLGNSWDKLMDGAPFGYDILALRLTNENFGNVDAKPTFFLMAEIHAREYVTAETAMRYAEYLISNYNIDPDITWLLDYFRVYIVTMTNPDGRKFAESGEWWRKNTDKDDGCTTFPDYGTDLNRNHSFKWNMGGSDNYACSELYHGPSAGSEPEVQAIEQFVMTIFPDQRGQGDADPAPLNSTGTFITLHAYGQLVLWPWGWTNNLAPNNTQLQTLGRHLAFFNNHSPQQSWDLYQTSGTSEEFAYGTLGIAAYTFEMGTNFFQGCTSFENTIYPDNRNALLYAFKTARRPYMNPAGPDTLSVTVTPNTVPKGRSVQLTASANDKRFNNSNGTEPYQNITEARYSIDDPSWITDTVTYSMTANDGNFNNPIENIRATINTTDLTLGRHTIFVESMDANGNWGIVSAVFLNVTGSFAPIAEFSNNNPINIGEFVNFNNQTSGTEPISYSWDFGDGIGTSTVISPSYLYTDIGIFTVTLVATNILGTDSISHAVTVKPNAITSVDLTLVSTDVIYFGDEVDFNSDLLPDNASMPYKYEVDFGDGMVITGTAEMEPLLFYHAFAYGGSYRVQISVKNDVMSEPVTDSLDLYVNYKMFLPLTSK
jgi:PKD repeat protein